MRNVRVALLRTLTMFVLPFFCLRSSILDATSDLVKVEVIVTINSWTLRSFIVFQDFDNIALRASYRVAWFL